MAGFRGAIRPSCWPGARVEVAPYKRDPGDFVLWKPSDGDLPGWHSPWGRGRPGWHIECSAMAHRYLDADFDIHGGGSDLLFPHHENERAQSLCGYPGSRFASIWLHNAMLLVGGEKMSKSLGNFFTVREILARVPAEVLRLLLLGTHYRSTLNFTFEGLAEAKQTLDRFYRALEYDDGTEIELARDRDDPFIRALCRDLNTPAAIFEMHQMANAVFRGGHSHARLLRAYGRMLGLFGSTSKQWFEAGADVARIERLVEERLAARTLKDFARADAIRAELTGLGVVLEDRTAGTVWRRA